MTSQPFYLTRLLKVIEKLPLRVVLMLAFVLHIMGIVGLISYLSYRHSQQTVETLATQLRQELTARIEQELRSYFKTPHEINRLNAAALASGDLDLQQAKFGEIQLYQQMKISPNVAFIYCGSANSGEFFGVLRLPEDGSLQLSYSNPSTQYLRQYYSLNVRGERTFFMRQTEEPFDSRQRPWFIAGARVERPVWTDIYIAFTTGLPNVTASLPVYEPTEKKLIGVCGTDVVLPKEFRQFLQNLKIGKTGQAFVIDRQGNLIANSTDEPLMVGTEKEAHLLPAMASRDPLVRGTADYLKTTFNGFAGITSPQQLKVDLAGERQFLEVLPFRDEFGLDWLIVVVVPESDFMAQIRANTRMTSLLSLLSVIVAIGLSILAARWLTRPIEQMTVASEAIATGKLTQYIEPSSSLELNQLASAFNSMALQLQDAFDTLEDKVRERTSALAEANTEIHLLNQQLQGDNLRMGAELDILRQMQQMVLPKVEELTLTGLDIAGFMEPAVEVAGDYYDVLYADGVVTLSMGDVTGHGLESGILMLMVHTAVRTLQESRETDPIRFLAVLNRTICKNVQRMSLDRNLTLVILNYFEGKVSISGQHEEILVFRNHGEVERIQTTDLGFPLGLDDEISAFVDSRIVEINPGEGIVLYTDGVTDAKDLDNNRYGIDRLCKVISQYRDLSANGIKQAIIDDLKGFIGKQRVFDDIALLVLKR
jgi:phosphoserine phosphatase RsbU/P